MSNLGTDVSWFPDLDPNLSLVSGNACLAEALYRRLMTVRGLYPWDPEYGLDISGLWNASTDPVTLATWQRQIAAELVKDERVFSASVTITQTSQVSLSINISAQIAGGPFALVLSVANVGVSILSFTS